MSSYAIRVLTHQPVRLALTVGGMALCVVLMLFLLAIYRGVSDGSVEYVRRSNADIWVLQENSTNILRSTSILSTAHERALSRVDGVGTIGPVLLLLPTLHANGKSATVFLAGYDHRSGLGGPPVIAEGRRIEQYSEIVLDRSFAARMRVRPGDSVQIQGRNLRVVGLSAGTNAFVIQYAFVTLDCARLLLGFPGIVSCYLVKTTPGAVPALVRSRIEEALQEVAVYEQPAFLANNIREMESGILPILYIVALMGTVVLTIILSLLLTINILERRKDFAVMKMLGAGKHFLPALVLEQAAAITLAGCAVALMLYWPVVWSVEWISPEIAVVSSPGQAALVVAISGAVGVFSALISIRRVRKIYPMEVFA
jgi:putative ABC transport system permease protein